MTEKWSEIQGTFELSVISSYRGSTTVFPNQKEGFLSNRPHLLWVYRRDNPLEILGEQYPKACKSRGEKLLL